MYQVSRKISLERQQLSSRRILSNRSGLEIEDLKESSLGCHKVIGSVTNEHVEWKMSFTPEKKLTGRSFCCTGEKKLPVDNYMKF